MATFTFSTLSLSSSRFFAPIHYHRSPNQPRLGLFGKTWHPRLLPLKCSSSSSSDPDTATNWTYKLIAGVSGIGFLETSYLTYLKLTGSDAFCPIGGGTCSNIINSDYALVFGVPLSLIGMVHMDWLLLSIQLATKNLPLGLTNPMLS
ncbi:VKOR domain superfamily [Sesbania bispinosa]|nr:VKOR domain superfamily [Sesbania bispinosa]